jgi:radical SAM protein with 4Fe4S-binding SPASM domain
MENLDYSQWSLDVHRQLSGKRVPISATIEMTHRCNNRCVHCYNNRSAGDGLARAGELDTREHLRILDEFAEAGGLWLLFTGGEVFLRPDFLEIYTHAKKLGLLTSIFTNGTLISEKIADHLADYRPLSMEITLYGCSRETYEGVTRTTGSYDACLRGIKLVRQRQLPLKLKTMALRANLHELWEMKRFVEQDLGLPFKFDGRLSPRTDCSIAPLEQRLSPAELISLDLKDPDRVAEFKRFVEHFHTPAARRQNPEALYICGGGAHSFSIDPQGGMRICVLSNGLGYDLRSGSLKQGWQEALLKIHRRKWSAHTKCYDCSIRSLCGMCPANATLESGDAERPVDFLCQLAHLRAYAFDIEIEPHGDCEYCTGGDQFDEMQRIVKAAKNQVDADHVQG